GREIRVRIARDPLRLVAGAELYRDDRPVASARIAGGGPLRLAVSGSDRMSVQVILVDEFGNHLLGLSPIEVAALPARASQAPPAPRSARPCRRGRTSSTPSSPTVGATSSARRRRRATGCRRARSRPTSPSRPPACWRPAR